VTYIVSCMLLLR